MPRATLNLQDPTDLRAVQAQWRFAPGLVPGEPNEGLVSQLEGSPARLVDYDDSSWAVCHDLTKGLSRGFTFTWYRISVTLPETVGEGISAAHGVCSKPVSTIMARSGSMRCATANAAPFKGSMYRSAWSSRPTHNRGKNTRSPCWQPMAHWLRRAALSLRAMLSWRSSGAPQGPDR